MSRILRYQNTISSFIKSKSCYIEVLPTESLQILCDHNHYCAILLLTIFNGQFKKKKTGIHCYPVACGIDGLSLIVDIIDNSKFYRKKYNDTFCIKFIKIITEQIETCIDQCIKLYDSVMESDEMKQLSNSILLYIYPKIINIIQENELHGEVSHIKNDIIKYKFKNSSLINKYKKFKRISYDDIINFTNNKYGLLGKCVFVVGWKLGFGDKNQISEVENIGELFGTILKLSNDFENLERDLELSDETSTNIVLNIGIEKSFSLFMEYKYKIYSSSIKLKIITKNDTILKELIDILEKKIMTIINSTDIDTKTEFSSYTD